ncbi:MAG: helix-turn-helix domain-containing protein [Candidatus Thermoplasmatota archaeon]
MYRENDESYDNTDIHHILAEKIAGEITLSDKPGQTFRKWRIIFDISQSELSHHLKITPSVISDYEAGRRKSPGINLVKRLIEALFEIDENQHNSKTMQKYQPLVRKSEGIIDIMEYPYGIKIDRFIEGIKGVLVSSPDRIDSSKLINGFTLVDSIKIVTSLNASNYVNLYGWSTDRAIVFTGVRYGRSPMIAIRVHPVKPALVVYHKPDTVDPLAIKLADRERIPIVTTDIQLADLRKRLIELKDDKEG